MSEKKVIRIVKREDRKKLKAGAGVWVKASEVLKLLKEYEQWEADLINDNSMWWPHAPQDALFGTTYDKMLELQQKRNRMIALLSPLDESVVAPSFTSTEWEAKTKSCSTEQVL